MTTRAALLWTLSLLVAGAPGAPAAPSGNAAEYRFGAGDVVEVTVAPQHSFDRTVTVQPDGKISYPVVGQLQAGGLTVAELTEKLQSGLNGELLDPRVTVSLKELNKHAVPRVSVLGQVKSAGVVEIKAGTTLAEALAAAGGPTPLGDLRRVTITREDRTVLTVDLAQTEKTGRLDGNVALQAGDLIVVPEGAPPTVLVLGEVLKAGSVELHGEARLLDALSEAGGPTPKADLRHITLARSGVAGTRTLDLQPLISGGNATDPKLNVALLPGDTILIPETDQQVYALGRLARPDLYPLKANERVLDLLAKAGGAAADGDISKAVLVRRDEKGQPVAKLLDLKKMMAKGRMAENELLRPGDVLFVPDKKTPHSAAEVANLLWPVTGLVNLFRR